MIWSSPDGVSWTRAPESHFVRPGNQGATAVAAGPEGFVAVGADFTPGAGEVLAWRSPDGASWEPVPIQGGGPPRSVSVGGPGFVAVGWLGSVWTSPDGAGWTEIEYDPQAFGSILAGFGAVVLEGVAVAPGGWLSAVGWDALDPGGIDPAAGGERVGAAWHSADGLNWTRVAHDPAVFGEESGYVQINGVTPGGPGLVAVGAEADFAPHGFLFNNTAFWEPSTLEAEELLAEEGLRGAVWTSADGLAWRRVPSGQLPAQGEGNTQLLSVAVGGPGLVAVGFTKTGAALEPVVWTSEDGETWSRATELEAAAQERGGQLMLAVAARGPGLVAVGADGSERNFTPAIWTSP